MKTLVVTGFACTERRWDDFLSSVENRKIISFKAQLEGAEDAKDLRSLGRYVSSQIETYKPELIFAHDFGVATLVMGLLRVRRKNSSYMPKVILFNSALRGLNLFRTTHPLRIQAMSWDKIRHLIIQSGGDCDSELEKFLPSIKAIYRQVVMNAFLDFWKTLVKKKPSPHSLTLGSSVLVFKSDTDPYFPGTTIQKMADDIASSQIVPMDYGHFPYSRPFSEYQKQIEIWLKK
jgi:hypothetical protein